MIPGNTSSTENTALKIGLASILKVVDSMDAETYYRMVTDDTRMKFGNFPASIGKEAVKSAQIEFFKSVKSVKHRVIKSWNDDDSIIAQMEVTYGRLDGTTVTIPVVDLFEIRDNKISACLIYMDISPLYQS